MVTIYKNHQIEKIEGPAWRRVADGGTHKYFFKTATGYKITNLETCETEGRIYKGSNTRPGYAQFKTIAAAKRYIDKYEKCCNGELGVVQ